MRPLRILYLFIFLLALGIGAATPVVPQFARVLGASYTQIGLLGTAYGLAFSVSAILLGRQSDHFGRKALLAGGCLLLASSAAGYSFAKNMAELFILRFAEGLSLAASFPAAEALCTELASVRGVGAAMGWMSAIYNGGYAGGSLLGGWVADLFGFRMTFTAYLVLALAALGTLSRLGNSDIPQPRSSVTRGPRFDHQPAWLDWDALFGYLIGAVYILNLGVLLTFFPVFARSLGLSIWTTGLAFSLFWVVRMVASLGAGSASDKLGRYPVLIGSLLVCCTGFMMIIVGQLNLLFPALIMLGLGLGASLPVAIALISDQVPQAHRGLAMGIFETSGGAASMFATTAGGFMADRLDPRAPYLIPLLSSAAAAILLAIVPYRWSGRSLREMR